MAVTADESAVKEKFFPKLARVLARVPLAEDLVAAYYCAFDRATPLKAKGILIGALAYFILPIDVDPGFRAGAGLHRRHGRAARRLQRGAHPCDGGAPPAGARDA